MSFLEISNDNLMAKISLTGAELLSLNKFQDDHNWIWSAQEPWQRSAPFLFPIVGRLKEDSYIFEGKKYQLSQHGFARDSMFEIVEQTGSSAKLRLLANSETLQIYPFNFELVISYWLEDSSLKMSCSLRNLGDKDLFYNFGWHPGFVLPNQHQRIRLLTNGELGGYHRLQNGLVGREVFPMQEIENGYELNPSFFENDALIFLNNGASEFILSDESGARMVFRSQQPPHFGLWTKNVKKYICLEPWWGHADLVQQGSQELNRKPGICTLKDKICLAQFEIYLGM